MHAFFQPGQRSRLFSWGSDYQPGVPGPLVVRNKIFGSPKKSMYVLGVLFFKRIEIFESLQVHVVLLKKILSSLIIPNHVTNSTI